MRKITKIMAQAFAEGSPRKLANTEVICKNPDELSPVYSMLLHGNMIAERDKEGVWISLVDWNTVTTRERLNGLLEHMDAKFRVAQRKGKAVMITQGGIIRQLGMQFYELHELNKLSIQLDNERARQYA